ncbi:MAG: hypothetical protein HUU14_06985 [Dehalococcoidia bacterium]|nr:hypothetical protein [Dehalococcoidia bacterium]NUQ55610.1 hypothetical protein [Dehalococcoidia bacterium]
MKALEIVAMLAGLLAVAGCGGGGPAVVPRIASVSAERDVEDGVAKLTTTIELEFDRPVRLAKSETPLTSHFEIRVLELSAKGERFRRVFVTRASFVAGSERKMVLSADALVPDGSTLQVARRAFARNATGEMEAPIQSDLSLEAALLATVAFTFGAPEILDTVPARGVTDADRDSSAVRAQLERHLRLRGASEDTRGRALALYDSIPESRVPGPKARAALAALTGLFAEPALGALLEGANCGGRPVSLIAFQAPPGDPRLLARVTTDEDGSRMVSLSPELEAERFEMLIPLLTHEAIHCDDRDGVYEEVAATAFDTFAYVHLVAIDPSLVEGRSRLTRELVVNVLLLINSGRRWPESVGVLRSAGAGQALPGSNNPAASFAEFVAAAYGQVGGSTSPEEPVAVAYAATLASAAGMPGGSPFDLRYLDELLARALDSGVLAGTIEALGLIPAD